MNKIQQIKKEVNLVDIRCPFKRKAKSTGDLILCNRICVRVAPGSRGEIRCWSCKLIFDFEVTEQVQAKTFIVPKKP